jgi:phospholipid/cholesterol/gamma-HCH transport system ATP-binding protein
MIQIKNLIKYFDGKKVLDDINLNINTGQFFTLMGGSGQGKSVFLQHIIGLLKPDKGSIYIDGQDIVPLKEKNLLEIRRNFGYLFQEGALFDYMNIYDNLALPVREHTTKDDREISILIKKALEEVELSGIEQKFPSQLSVGMRKRVGLARAIILQPKLLLCDEPTSGLDPATGYAISCLILKLCRELKTTTIVVTHDVINFFDISDCIAIIHEGRIAAIGTKDEIRKSEDELIRRFVINHPI